MYAMLPKARQETNAMLTASGAASGMSHIFLVFGVAFAEKDVTELQNRT